MSGKISIQLFEDATSHSNSTDVRFFIRSTLQRRVKVYPSKYFYTIGQGYVSGLVSVESPSFVITKRITLHALFTSTIPTIPVSTTFRGFLFLRFSRFRTWEF